MSTVSAAIFDYQSGTSWSSGGDRWFHAASTIKVAVLGCVYRALEEEGLDTTHPRQVRNVFASAADGTPFSVPAARDPDAETHASIGKAMPVADLARRMIVVSGNLATNVLLEFVGVGRAQRILAGAGLDASTGVELLRGVEDERAFDAGLSNRVTANGLVALLRAILDGRLASEAHTARMLDLLAAQTFRNGIPAGLPPAVRAAARIAHKTGEISTATHDAGIVFLPGRAPYVLAVLTDSSGTAPERYAPIAEVSARVFEAVSESGLRGLANPRTRGGD